MALVDNEARILDSLRPIFPQLNDRVLSNCIRNVQETVGSDPASIIPGCIDVLLAGQIVPEIPEAQHRPTVLSIPPEDGDYRGNSRVQHDDDDVIFVSSNSRSPKTPGHVINLIEEPEEPEIISYSGSSALNNSTLTSPRSQSSSRTTEPKRNSLSESTFSTAATETTTSTAHSAAQEPCEIQAIVPGDPPPSDPMEEALQNLLSFFPDVEDAYLQSLIDKWSHIPLYEAINNACDVLLEKRDYPRKSRSQLATVTSPVNDQKKKDYFKDFSSGVSSKYHDQCCQLLHNEFKTIPMKHIRSALAKFKGHYAPSRVYLQEQLRVSSVSYGTATSTTTLSQGTDALQSSALQTISTTNQGFFIPPKIKLLKCGRSPVRTRLKSSETDEELQREIDFVRNYELSKSEERDRMLAVSLNDEQYEEEGQKIECGCCYGDSAFEDMVQCLEGHLFCASCLMNYAKEATFGQGKATLTCMTDGCNGSFPLSQLKKALPTNILEKYEDRVKDEALLMAQMDDFVQCPSCDFGAILPPDDKVFKCQNPSCAKETCRYCKEDWSEHFGLKCKEVEKTAHKDVRLSYEEKMTMAKIRKCPKCGCEFTKSDGCNKMTCRCGTTMCYVCRKPKISYNHFCQHPKDPGKPCAKCKSCSLWSDPSEDDNRAVKELEKEALEVKRKFEAEGMGVEDSPAKKVKTN